MFDTLQKRCKLETLKNYVVSNKSLTKAVVSDSCKKDLEGFINSPDNIKRSISTFYSAGVLGKRKYQSVRQALSMKNHPSKVGAKTRITLSSGFKMPKLLTYNNLMAEVKRIDIGKVYEIDENYVAGIDSDENVNGAYRDLREYLPRLARFYLQKNTKETLKWFGETEGTFLVAFGGDGCPFGKHESACSFLISFLNVGRKVMSSNDNFIVFGANCQETSPVVKKYVNSAVRQIVDLEGKIFEIEGLSVTFKIKELPNDMKMVAMLAGELSISARYFSPFANVSKDDCTNLKGTFGVGRGHTWEPWKYEQRVAVVQKVDNYKETLAKQKCPQKQMRPKITDFIAKQKSRQEFVPLVGKIVEKAHVEPLHLKNNAWQYFFRGVLKESIRKSKLPKTCKKFSDVPVDSAFSRVITSLQMEVKCKCLARKVKEWFDDTQGLGVDLTYRFTGKDSKRFCHNFMLLIKWLSHENDSHLEKQRVLVFAYLGLRLRDAVSLFNRFATTEEQLSQLAQTAIEYFRVNALFVETSVNPTVWTLGHVVPVHARQVFEQYGQGLGTVTMEGREAKHIFLKRLSENTTYQRRWVEILKHEFIMMVWLPEQGFKVSENKVQNAAYIPPRVFSDPAYCYCGLLKACSTAAKCTFCIDPVMRLIEKSITDGKITAELK